MMVFDEEHDVFACDVMKVNGFVGRKYFT